ncbi:ArnT family glycosyltransferase [Gemmata sp.]|uniref:ArnT family glycosyltransferase n=1 Tax=Gemmata sp. TaxID=1914242 RepID=UPI003F7053EA
MRNRLRDYTLLLAACAALSLPNLGAGSLWDMDEAVNSQAAREMRDADTWVIPTFNYQLRTAKPVMLYWLQRASYAAFGVSEWSARLPSVLAGWLIVLLTYELARGMFGRPTGLLGGVVLASVTHFAVLTHAATPDATLLLYTTLTYYLFWTLHQNGSRRWWVPTAAACGLAMLTKGPVGLALPGAVILAYFAWNRELGRLLDRRIFAAALTFILVGIPWYGLVAAETRGEWLRAFFGNENVNRFMSPMEGHSGGVWFYPLTVTVLFSPWSAFLLAAVWYGVRATKRDGESGRHGEGENKTQGDDGAESSLPISPSPRLPISPTTDDGDTRAYRFLVCWAGLYLVFFSAAATKLPNYVFPLYPALAVLTARFLIAWRDGSLTVPRWLMPAGAAGMLLIGAVTVGAMLYANRLFPGLAAWSPLGLVPVAAGAWFGWNVRRGDRHAAVAGLGVAAVAFMAPMMACTPALLEQKRAPRALVAATGLGDPTRDLRVAAFGWFEPSVVFYTGREVARLDAPAAVAEFLAVPTPGYVFVHGAAWEKLSAEVPTARVVAKRYDFLKRCDVLVVTNERSPDVAAAK